MIFHWHNQNYQFDQTMHFHMEMVLVCAYIYILGNRLIITELTHHQVILCIRTNYYSVPERLLLLRFLSIRYISNRWICGWVFYLTLLLCVTLMLKTYLFQSLIQKYKFLFVSVNYWMTKEKRFVDNPIHPVLITSLNDFEVNEN